MLPTHLLTNTKKYYLVEGIKVIDRLSGRTKRAIMVQARRLGIGTKKNKISRSLLLKNILENKSWIIEGIYYNKWIKRLFMMQI